MLKLRQTSGFCSRLQELLLSGLPLLESLTILQQLSIDRKEKAGLEKIIAIVSEGGQFSRGTEGFLPELALGSIRTAERKGGLEETLGQLAKYFEDQADLNDKLIGSLIYPAILLTMSLVTIMGLVIFILPGMKSVLSDLGASLPLSTLLVLNLAEGLARSWPLLFVIPAILFFCLRRRLKPELVEEIVLKTPIVGRQYRKSLNINFFGQLGSLLRGGVPVVEALSLAKESSFSPRLICCLSEACRLVEEGEGLSSSLSDRKLFPAELIGLVRLGENSGALGERLSSISNFLAKERESELKKITTLIEPALTLGVGLVIGGVALVVFLPLLSTLAAFE